MSRSKKAVDLYKGLNGNKRANCAQSVTLVLKELFNITDETLALMENAGSGKAPEGFCGAVYAAQKILADNSPDKLAQFNEYFAQKGGSLKCREIRKMKKLDCSGCVAAAVDFFEEK